MLRQFIHVLVLLMLVMQGVTLASADVRMDSDTQHCASHDMAQNDCPCCDSTAISAGCTALCSAIATLPGHTFAMPFSRDEHESQLVHWRAGPSYLPLNPPPIS